MDNFSNIVAGVWKWGVWGWNLESNQVLTLIEKCIDYGVTTFDHADIYGHYTDEALFGAAVALKPSIRQQMQLVTKCGIKLITPNRPQHQVHAYDTSRKHIIASVEQSLRNLHTDFIDLLLIHRPDPLLNPDEVAEAITQLQEDGKILKFGVSNFTTAQFEMLRSRISLVTNQLEISISKLDNFLDGSMDYCIQHRMRPMAWSPLGSGKIFTAHPDEKTQRIIDKANEIGKRHGNWGIDQVLLAWLMMHPARILPVLGTARAERIKAAVEAQALQLSRDEWFELWVASTGKPIP